VELPPEPASLSVEPGGLPGKGNVLAGETPADDVDGLCRLFVDVFDMLKPLRVGPVFFEHRPAEFILLGLPHRVAKPGPFEAKLQAADPGE